MTLQEQETRLRAALRPAPLAFASDAAQPLKAASVLIPMVGHEEGFSVLLTQRTSHLRHHPGQISFPGGGVEAGDRSPMHTALRETREEIGLAPERVEVIGYLPDYCTVTGFCITPVVGIVTPPFELRPDAEEVAEIFEVPLSFLLDPANHRRQSIVYAGELRSYFSMPYQGYNIWGATAGMIVSLYQALSAQAQ